MNSEFPLLVFTVLTGLSAGSYIMATVFGLISKENKRTFVFNVICLACLGVGLLGVLFHLGHPERFMNGLANPTSMIAQEGYWAILFGLLLFVDTILLFLKKRNSILPIVISVLGCGLLTVTSIEYFTSYGVAGWPEVPTILQFIGAGLATGAAFTTAFLKIAPEKKNVLTSFVLYLVLVIALFAEAFVFGALPVGSAPFVVAAIIAGVGAFLSYAPLTGKTPEKKLNWPVFVLILLAVIITRYAFYSAF